MTAPGHVQTNGTPMKWVDITDLWYYSIVKQGGQAAQPGCVP